MEVFKIQRLLWKTATKEQKDEKGKPMQFTNHFTFTFRNPWSPAHDAASKNKKEG